MRIALAALLLLAASSFTATAQSDPYGWCAHYFGDGLGGASNCYFVTLEQCRATVSGIGGYCAPNPRYTGPGAQPARRARPRT